MGANTPSTAIRRHPQRRGKGGEGLPQLTSPGSPYGGPSAEQSHKDEAQLEKVMLFSPFTSGSPGPKKSAAPEEERTLLL